MGKVRKSIIRKFLGSFHNWKSSNFKSAHFLLLIRKPQIHKFHRRVASPLIQTSKLATPQRKGRPNDHSTYCIDFRPNMPYSLAWLVGGPNTLGGGSLWYQTDHGTIQTLLLGAVHSCVPSRLAARQIFSYKWEAAGWGE
jgi:hypothetical protein